MPDTTIHQVHETPKEFWGPLLDQMPTHGWGVETAIANALARLQGTPPPAEPPSAADEIITAPSGRPMTAQAQTPGDTLAVQDAYQNFAQNVVKDNQARLTKITQAQYFLDALAYSHRLARDVLGYLSFATQIGTAEDAARARQVAEVWDRVADGITALLRSSPAQ